MASLNWPFVFFKLTNSSVIGGVSFMKLCHTAIASFSVGGAGVRLQAVIKQQIAKSGIMTDRKSFIGEGSFTMI
jgi:hypothetical protein